MNCIFNQKSSSEGQLYVEYNSKTINFNVLINGRASCYRKYERRDEYTNVKKTHANEEMQGRIR
ncbi:hypothetical protein CWI37_0082p0010 [Hamiltosporidium tvaerminnensis]|uniref:Uncharacterized protein n=1 Tax=Hamiltosporidium tvaerminnensis TaxID=1176355 RepID=A0A4Q9L6L1_9MICR|nr:hypothetical protein CWI37_0344p0010 [Hamiltosporidium tvaerminnensis]TBU04834.1 hypothetical protein CWI37_0082p0010 [Hamiltosporidium tvaerminnensis]